MSATFQPSEQQMSERQPVAIDTDVAYHEQRELLEFYRNRILILAQENKLLRLQLAAVEAAVAPAARSKRIRRGAATKET